MACAAPVRRASGAVSRRLTNTPRASDRTAASSAAHTNDRCTWRRKAWPWASNTASTGRTFNKVPMTRPSRVIGTPWARTFAGSTSPTSSPVLLASTRPAGSATAKLGPAPAPARPQPIPSPYRPGQAAPAARPRQPSFPAPRSIPSGSAPNPSGRPYRWRPRTGGTVRGWRVPTAPPPPRSRPGRSPGKPGSA